VGHILAGKFQQRAVFESSAQIGWLGDAWEPELVGWPAERNQPGHQNAAMYLDGRWGFGVCEKDECGKANVGGDRCGDTSKETSSAKRANAALNDEVYRFSLAFKAA
jgi:hypothetical protein